jgi:hypothetical protein
VRFQIVHDDSSPWCEAANVCWCRAFAQRRGRSAVGRLSLRSFPRRPSPHASASRDPPAAPTHVARGKAKRELVLGVMRAKGEAEDGVGRCGNEEGACASSGSLRRRAAASAPAQPLLCTSRTEVLRGEEAGQDGLKRVGRSCGV